MRIILFIVAASLWFAGFAHAKAVLPDCSAFPVLAEVIDQLDILERAPDDITTILVATRIEDLRLQIPSTQLSTRLHELGLERHLTQVNAFRVRLGALTQIARKQGRDALRPYLLGSGFQRSKQHTRELLSRICEDTPSTSPSVQAQRDVSLWSGTGISRRTSLRVAAGFGALVMLIACVAGAYCYVQWHRRWARRVAKRVACNIPAVVTLHGTAHSAPLVDISLGGANLSHRLDLPTGTVLKLQFANSALNGTVMWSNKKFAGLKFDRVLTEEELRAALSIHTPARRIRNKKRGARWGTA